MESDARHKFTDNTGTVWRVVIDDEVIGDAVSDSRPTLSNIADKLDRIIAMLPGMGFFTQ